VNSQIDRQILIGFLEEAMGYLPAIRQGVEEYIAHRNINSILAAHRFTHTIKGAASMVGFADLSHISYSIEVALEEIAYSFQPISAEKTAFLITTIDELENRLNELSHDTLEEPPAPGAEVETEKEPAAVSSSITAPADQDEEDEPEIDPEMVEVFSMEAEDHLRLISAGLSALDQDSRDRESLQAVRRSAHTLKGAAGVVGMRTITKLSHRMEDLLDQLYEGSREVTPDAMSILLASAEVLENLVRGASPKSVRGVTADLYARYATLLNATEISVEDATSAETRESVTFSTYEPVVTVGNEAVIDLEQFAAQSERSANADGEVESTDKVRAGSPGKRAASRVVRVPLERLDALVKLISELVISRTVLEQRMSDFVREVEELQHSTDRMQRVSTKLGTEYEAKSFASGNPTLLDVKRIRQEIVSERLAAMPAMPGSSFGTDIAPSGFAPLNFAAHGFDELEFDRFTEFHSLSRELAEASGDANAVGNELENLLGDFDQVLNRQRRLTSEIQERLMRVRMVPLSTLSARLQRTVRVTADKEQKLVDLRLEGENIELDTTVLDQIADPLLHLLRNSVGHGIEPPTSRRGLGKPERGTIILRAFHEGTETVIEVTDDGRGLDPAAIRQKVAAEGFFSHSEVEAMSDKEVFNLIFLPGLSTAQEVSEVSGRGVGMDVVKEHITKLQGTLVLDSVPGRGVRFTLRLPMTLAVTRALLVRANEETFALPLNAVKQIMRIERSEIDRLGAEPVVRVGGNVYPLIRLGQILNLRQPADETMARVPVLILSVGGRQIALAVDQLIEGREIVIKSLGNHLRRVPGLMGATLMGNGRVIPILNPVDLVGSDTMTATPIREARASKGSQPATRRRTISVMIVDDSPSVRRVMTNLAGGAGWQSSAAKDGLEALEILQTAHKLPDVILADIEMPRMDGYELLAALKRQDNYRGIPVVMITSRTGEKHRRKALDLGASEYLSKPYQDEVLLDLVRKLAN
jgi:chemosensory pili system protein ChpA (sensor histidine kinase/response regulator)